MLPTIPASSLKPKMNTSVKRSPQGSPLETPPNGRAIEKVSGSSPKKLPISVARDLVTLAEVALNNKLQREEKTKKTNIFKRTQPPKLPMSSRGQRIAQKKKEPTQYFDGHIELDRVAKHIQRLWRGRKLLKQMKSKVHPEELKKKVNNLERFILPPSLECYYDQEFVQSKLEHDTSFIPRQLVDHLLQTPHLTEAQVALGYRELEIRKGKTVVSKLISRAGKLNKEGKLQNPLNVSMKKENAKKINDDTYKYYLETPLHYIVKWPGVSKIVQHALEKAGDLTLHGKHEQTYRPSDSPDLLKRTTYLTGHDHLAESLNRAAKAVNDSPEASTDRKFHELTLKSLMATAEVVENFIKAGSNPQVFREHNIARNKKINEQRRKAVNLVSLKWPRALKKIKNDRQIESKKLLVEKRKEADQKSLSEISDPTLREQLRKELIMRNLAEYRIKRAANSIGEGWKRFGVRERVIAANLKKKDDILRLEREKHQAAERKAAAEATAALEASFTSEDEAYDLEFLKDLRKRIANGQVVVPEGYNP